MNRLEDELRNALRREGPPEGFAEGVLARAAKEVPANRRWFRPALLFPSRRFRFAVVAACVLLAVAGVDYRNGLRERARGEAAKAQLMLSLRITGSKLQLAQQKVREIQAPRNYRN